jgi:hypothetical protein
MTDLSPALLARLRTQLPPDTLAAWSSKFQAEQDLEKQKVNTPATNSTNSSWRKQGNAIDKIRRKRTFAPS